MRASIVLFAVGEVLALAGIAMWSVPLALVLAGIQCAALALFREQAVAKKPVAKSTAKPRHRRTARSIINSARPKLRLVGRDAA